MAHSADSSETFLLPDLVSHCNYPLRLNPNCYDVARTSERWLLAGANHNEARANAFMGFRAGELTAACYPDTDPFRLRVCSDVMNYLFNLDDWLDEFDVARTNGLAACCIGAFRDPFNFDTDKAAGKMTKSFFSRFVQDAGLGCTERFIHTMELFFKAVAQQSADRTLGWIPDLESYVPVRRDTSACKPCFALIEYAAGIDLPDDVIDHPTIRALEEATNDLVTWSNDIFSYSVEQSRNDTHNMIPIMMYHHNFTLQEAVDFVGDQCKASIERFEADRASLPSWGPELDRDITTYIDGLQNWIVGSLHWSFESERYFGKCGSDVKRHRVVHLLPKKSV